MAFSDNQYIAAGTRNDNNPILSDTYSDEKELPRVPSGRKHSSRGRGQLEKSVHQFTRDDLNFLGRNAEKMMSISKQRTSGRNFYQMAWDPNINNFTFENKNQEGQETYDDEEETGEVSELEKNYDF